jgi:hypothetical protein
MPAVTFPTMEELSEWARTRTFSDIERDRRIVAVDFDGERWSYPKSDYYNYDDPVELERRSGKVNRFLSRIVAILKEKE